MQTSALIGFVIAGMARMEWSSSATRFYPAPSKEGSPSCAATSIAQSRALPRSYWRTEAREQFRHPGVSTIFTKLRPPVSAVPARPAAPRHTDHQIRHCPRTVDLHRHADRKITGHPVWTSKRGGISPRRWRPACPRPRPRRLRGRSVRCRRVCSRPPGRRARARRCRPRRGGRGGG